VDDVKQVQNLTHVKRCPNPNSIPAI
jgi:hypothetical protein